MTYFNHRSRNTNSSLRKIIIIVQGNIEGKRGRRKTKNILHGQYQTFVRDVKTVLFSKPFLTKLSEFLKLQA